MLDMFRQGTEGSDRAIKVTAEHVERGSELLQLLERLKDIAVNPCDHIETAKADVDEAEKSRLEMVDYLKQGGAAFDRLWSQRCLS